MGATKWVSRFFASIVQLLVQPISTADFTFPRLCLCACVPYVRNPEVGRTTNYFRRFCAEKKKESSPSTPRMTRYYESDNEIWFLFPFFRGDHHRPKKEVLNLFVLIFRGVSFVERIEADTNCEHIRRRKTLFAPHSLSCH